MNTKMNYFALFITLLSFFVLQSFDKYDLEEHITKEFKLNPEGTFDIYNKYGKVDIKNWDNQSVKIDVHIKVDARNEKKAQETMDRISIDFENNANFVSAKTTIGEENSGGISISYNNKFTINYTIYMPRNVHLNVFNKYGHTTIEELDRTVNAEIKYGNIDMENVKGDVSLKLGYGNANFKNVRNLSSEIKYSNLEATSVGNFNMHSKYSKIIVEEAKDVVIESKYDTYRLGTVLALENQGKYDNFRIKSAESTSFDTKYTDVSVEYLHTKFHMDQKYGSVKIGETGNKMEEVYVETEYTDVRIRGINTGYNLDMELENSDYNVHDDISISYKSKDDDCCDLRMKGDYGNGYTKIFVRMRYGGFTIN